MFRPDSIPSKTIHQDAIWNCLKMFCVFFLMTFSEDVSDCCWRNCRHSDLSTWWCVLTVQLIWSLSFNRRTTGWAVQPSYHPLITLSFQSHPRACIPPPPTAPCASLQACWEGKACMYVCMYVCMCVCASGYCSFSDCQCIHTADLYR